MTAPAYIVRADVFDIKRHTPKEGDAYLVDSNVLVWMTYTRASLSSDDTPLRYQSRDYVAFVKNAHRARARFVACSLAFAELAHVIERAERSIFNATHGGGVETKEYRHNHDGERARVVEEIKAAWTQARRIADCLGATLSLDGANKALARLESCRVDGMDAIIIEAMLAATVRNVLTDDGDFSTVPGLSVFTANPRVLELADAQGKRRC